MYKKYNFRDAEKMFPVDVGLHKLLTKLHTSNANAHICNNMHRKFRNTTRP